MELTKTAKLQIYTTEDEKILLLNSMRAYSDACNYVSHYVYTTKDLSQVSVQKHTYAVCRLQYGLSSQMACNVVRTVIGSYKTLRKQLQQVGTPSSRRRLKSIGQRENRWMQDVNHQVSKALVARNPKGTLHVIEDLSGIRSAAERVRIKDRYVFVSWSYYDLEQKLIYKVREHGQKVIKVNPHYTSQTCPKCGHIEAANRDKLKHIFCCKNCGYSSNDDRIGAMNLYRMGIEYLVESQVSTSDL